MIHYHRPGRSRSAATMAVLSPINCYGDRAFLSRRPFPAKGVLAGDFSRRTSAARDGSDDKERLLARCDFVRDRGVRRFVRQISFAGEESQEGTPLLCHVIPDRATQHWVAGLEPVENRALCDLPFDLDLDISGDFRQRPQVRREDDAYVAHESPNLKTRDGFARCSGNPFISDSGLGRKIGRKPLFITFNPVYDAFL